MAKRLRSLASILWDTDDPELNSNVDPSHARQGELQLENAHLREKVQQLELELRAMKLRAIPHQPVVNQSSEAEVDFGDLGLKHPWLCLLRADVARLPRLCHEILPDLEETCNCQGSLEFALHRCRTATASQVARHVEAVVRKLSCISGCVQGWDHCQPCPTVEAYGLWIQP